MSSPLRKEIEELFHALVDLSPEASKAYLQAHPPDPAALAEVLATLRFAEADFGSFLEMPAAERSEIRPEAGAEIGE